jgi:hypothetical protein
MAIRIMSNSLGYRQVIAICFLGGLYFLSACGQQTSPNSSPDPQIKNSPEPKALPSLGFIPAEVPSVYRFANVGNGAYFYTGSEDEVRQILDLYPHFRFEGPSLEKDVTGGGQAVYRFAKLDNGGYFFTGSDEERDIVLRNYPNMRYEGTSFSVAPAGDVDAPPIFRLANLTNGAYLYTESAAERDYAQSLGMWRYEGSTFRAAVGSVLKNRSWRTGQSLEQGDSPVDDFDVQIDDVGQAMAIFFKESNARRTLFATRGLPGAGPNLSWATPVTIDLDAAGMRLSVDNQIAQGTIKPTLAMASNGNAFAVWSTLADCGVDNYQAGPSCSYLVGAAYSASSNAWSPAQTIASSPFGGDVNVKINSRGDVAVKYTGWQAGQGGSIENIPALVWRSAASPNSPFRKASFPDGKANLGVAIRSLGLDQAGRMFVGYSIANSTGPAKLVVQRGQVDTGLGSQEQISAAGEWLHFVTGRTGRTLITYIENNGVDVLKAATTAVDGTGDWQSALLVSATAGLNQVRQRYVDSNASFASVDDAGNARIQSLRCHYLQFRLNQWSAEKSSVSACTPQGLSLDPLVWDRDGNYVSIEGSSYGAQRWVSYDAKRNRAIHAIDFSLPLSPGDMFFKLVPTEPLPMALDWTRTKSAMSINGTAIIVARGALDSLPTVGSTSGQSRACGNGVPCISNLWAFALQ